LVEVVVPIGSGNLNIVIGLVGHGRWGQRHLATLLNLKSEGHISEVYVCDIDPKRLEALPEAVNGTFTSFTTMLDEVRIDALAIVTPPESHLTLATQALEREIPLLVEKPLSTDLSETSTFLDHLSVNATMIVGYLLRHHPGVEKMIAHYSAKDLSPPRRFQYMRHTPRERPQGAHPIETLAVHALDLCSLFLKSPLRTFDVGTLLTTEESAFIELQGEDGRSATIDVAWGAGHEVRALSISGAEDEMELDFGTNRLIHRHFGTQHDTVLDVGQGQPLDNEWRCLLSAITEPKTVLLPSRNELLDHAHWLHTHR